MKSSRSRSPLVDPALGWSSGLSVQVGGTGTVAHAGVVLLRLAGVSPEERAEAVSSVFRDRASELPGNFTVVERDAVRVRRLRVAAAPGTLGKPHS